MEEKKNYKRTTVTAALPYANGGVHIGHLAGVYVPADIYVRYLRLKKQDVKFICGSDEHGVPITIRAKKEGITPQQVVDRYHAMIKKSFADFGISFDIYSRTTSETHSKTASDFFKKLYDEGKLVEKTSMQYYDEEAKQFLADRYITGECPHCHNPKAYGDQCEKCGSDLDPTELINPVSTISGSKPVLKETKNWYLPLNEYQDWLKQHFETIGDRVHDLERYGVVFEKNPNGTYNRIEGQGSSDERPIKTLMFHGPQFMEVMRKACEKTGVKIVDRVMCVSLVHDKKKPNAIRGVMGFHGVTGELYLFRAKAVVLTTMQALPFAITSSTATS